MFRPKSGVRKKRIDERYEVGDDGVVYSDGMALEPIGGVGVNLHGERRKIAYLVARAFVGNQEGRPYVVHLNGDVTDNRAENLAWSETEEVRKKGRKPLVKWCAAYKVDGEQVGLWRTPVEAALEMKLDVRLIRKCCNGAQKTAGGLLWRWVG